MNKFINIVKSINIIFGLLFSFIAHAQSPHFTPIHNAQAIDWLDPIKYLGIPHGPLLTLNVTGKNADPAFFYLTADSIGLYYWDGSNWKKFNTGISNILTGKLAYVDAVNGNDATGILGNFSKPFLTLSAAKTAATAGYTIIVRPGSYSTIASIAKDNVNWLFYPGTTVSMTEEDDIKGIWDDGGTAMSFNVWGQGKFIRSVVDSRTDANLVFISNASSNVTIEASELIASGDDGDIETIKQNNGKLIVKADYITAIGSSSITTFWRNGSLFITASKITGGNSVIWAEVDDSPTGDFHVNADEILATESSSSSIYTDGTKDSAAFWVNAQTIRGDIFGGGNKGYITCQKVFGKVSSIYANAPLYVTADKITDIGQGLVIMNGTANKIFLNVKELDPSIYSGNMTIASGELQMNGADYVGTSSSTGFSIMGGIVKLTDCNFNTSLNSATSPIIKSGGTLSIKNCSLFAHSSATGIAAPTAQAVISYGSFVDRVLDTDITITGEVTVINTTSLDSFLIRKAKISSNSDSAYVKDPLTGKVSYAKINGSGSSLDSNAIKALARFTFKINDQKVGDRLKFDSTNRLINYTPNAGFRLIQFKPGYNGAPAIGDSVYTSTLIRSKYAQVSRNGIILALNEDFQKDSIGSSITFHPPLDSLDKIVINAYDLFPPITQLNPDSAWYPLNFPIRQSLTNNNTGIYTSTGGGGFDALGLANSALTGNGMIKFIYANSDMENSVLGFNTSNSLENFTGTEAGIYVATSGLVYYIENGSATSTGVNLSVGDQVGVRRIGSTFYLQRSINSGITWTTMQTFGSFTSSALLYVNVNLLNSSSKFYHPQILK